ncbi:MAG: tetratricopeptide repeat-containing sulfotransferase family protein [Gammaproteobacteria bacterium]
MNPNHSPTPRAPALRTLYDHLDRSEHESAEALSQQLLEVAPNDPELLYLHGVVAHKSGRPEEAIVRFLKAIPEAPSAATRSAVLSGLGKSYWMLEQLELAQASFAEAAKLHPQEASIWIDLGSVQMALGDPGAARSSFEKALAIDPDQADACAGRGLCLVNLGRYVEAREALEEVAQRYPGHAEVIQGLATLDKIMGRVEEAEHRLFALLTKQPERMGYFELASLKPIRSTDEPVVKLLETRREPLGHSTAPEIVRIDLLFALAKAYDDLGRSEESFTLLEEGARLRRRRFHFDITQEEERMERIAGIFGQTFIDRLKLSSGHETHRPIFIVGLPRSGSTLVEHLLSAHPDITPGGELPIFPRLATELSLAWGQIPGFPDALTPDRARVNLEHLKTRYLEEIEDATGPAPLRTHVTDKLLGNFLFLGLIRMAFPEARILHIQRHPLDQAHSAYRQLFTRGHAYSYDLMEFGRYYLAYRKLMEHWHTVLGDAIYDLSYEALVREPEAEIRKMLDFLKLPFVAGCLETHQASRPVHTASATQVREPIHPDAIGHWKRYRAQLEPLRKMLEPWIPPEPH